MSARRKHQPAQTMFPMTDSGNAELIASMFGNCLRFNHRTKRWLLWQRERWVEDRDGEVMRIAKLAARSRLNNASSASDDDVWRKLAAWAIQSESKNSLKAALELAKSTPPIADAGIGWDSNPSLLSVSNGVVDLLTGQLRPATPEDRITLHAAVPYDPASPCPRLKQFMREVFLNDDEIIRYVQKAVGYSLTGDISEQCLFLCYGAGANGKSTFLETVRILLGDYSHNMPFSALEANARTSIPNDIASLVSRRFVTASETSENVTLNEGRVKMLTGGDRCTGRFLYCEHFDFDPTAKFWLAFNHKPRVTDDSHGFWRRVRLIPFEARFDGATQDKNLAATLKAEASGILAWAVQGCLLWRREGLDPPARVQQATNAYRDESDPLGEFLEDRCEVCAGEFLESAHLWQAYSEWAIENDEKPLDQRSLGSRLRLRGHSSAKATVQGKRVRGWMGLRLKAEFSGATSAGVDTRTDMDARIQ